MTSISQIDKHLKKEFEDWEKIQQKELGKLISAKRHLCVNIGAYLLISVIEGILSSISGSQTLKADAFNNLSGIISTVLLIIGIHIASDIDDDDIAGIPLPKISLRKTGNDQRIQFTRWRYETIFTLVTGIIMIVIASSVIIDGIKALLNPSERIVPQPIALLGAAIASIIMVLIWIYNKRAGLRLKNAALTASAKDSLSDALTSIGTLFSIGGALLFDVAWLDGAASIVVGIYIFYSGLCIFTDSSLNLADYFNPQAEKQFREYIEKIDDIKEVDELKAHYNGNLVTLDVVVIVDGTMSVLESYRLGEKIESLMLKNFGIIDTDVSFIPDSASDENEHKNRIRRNRNRF